MKVTVTLEHWNKAKRIDANTHSTRTEYCPIAQALMEMGFPNVRVRDDMKGDELRYVAEYGDTFGVVPGCGADIATMFDIGEGIPELPCSFELPDAS